METVNESSLGNEVHNIIRHAQETGESVQITNADGQVIAHLIPATLSSTSSTNERAWTELQYLIDAISPYLPEHVNAVQAVRDIRR